MRFINLTNEELVTLTGTKLSIIPATEERFEWSVRDVVIGNVNGIDVCHEVFYLVTDFPEPQDDVRYILGYSNYPVQRDDIVYTGLIEEHPEFESVSVVKYVTSFDKMIPYVKDKTFGSKQNVELVNITGEHLQFVVNDELINMPPVENYSTSALRENLIRSIEDNAAVHHLTVTYRSELPEPKEGVIYISNRATDRDDVLSVRFTYNAKYDAIVCEQLFTANRVEL